MTDSLFKKWRAYEKLVENDYMGHARFFQRVEDEVKRRCGKPVAILDLDYGSIRPRNSRNSRLNSSGFGGAIGGLHGCQLSI